MLSHISLHRVDLKVALFRSLHHRCAEARRYVMRGLILLFVYPSVLAGGSCLHNLLSAEGAA